MKFNKGDLVVTEVSTGSRLVGKIFSAMNLADVKAYVVDFNGFQALRYEHEIKLLYEEPIEICDE